MSEAQRPKLQDPKHIATVKHAGNQVAKEAGGTLVADFFEMNKDTIKAVLPQHMTADRMLKIALRCLRVTPKLMQCTVSSLFGAVVTCAQLGLEPNTPQGHIYLIPFENRKKNITEVQVIIGYKGLIDLARRSGEIVSISSHPVFNNDPFEIMFGTDEKIVHRPHLDGDRGDIVGFYAVAKLTDGGTQLEFMSASEVNAIRDGAQGYRTAVRFQKQGEKLNTPWATNYEEMGRKTVIRRLCKYLPMSIELAHASALDERGERGQAQGLDNVIDLDAAQFSVVDDEPEDGTGAETTSITHDQTPKVTVPEEKAKETASRGRGRAAAAQKQPSGMPEADPSDPGQQIDHDPETGEIHGDLKKITPEAAARGRDKWNSEHPDLQIDENHREIKTETKSPAQVTQTKGDLF